MRVSLIILRSMTEAGKARFNLDKYKINAVIEKVTLNSGGCGYGIRVKDDPDKVCRLLSLSGINCVEIRD